MASIRDRELGKENAASFYPSPKAGLITLLDPRTEFYEYMLKSGINMKQSSEFQHNLLRGTLVEKGDLNVLDGGFADSREKARNAVTDLIAVKGAECLMIMVPGWTSPVIGAVAAQTAKFHSVPVMVIGWSALSGPTAVKGALDEIGVDHKAVWIYGPVTDPAILSELVAFAKAASVAVRLRGMKFGIFGGSALGIMTAAIDPNQWFRIFGIEVEQVDQVEIVREAEEVPSELVAQYMGWLKGNVKKITEDGQRVTKEKIEKQVRCYIATKNLIKEHGLNFMGLKCQTELSDKYVNQCLTPTFLNDPYDAEGPKDTVPCSCEGDANSALTMQILKMLSGGKPVFFGDLMLFDRNTKTIAVMNCGGASTWFATASMNPADNLKEVQLLPHVQGKAGGAAVFYVATKAGEPITWARLVRQNAEYKMFIVKGKVVRSKSFEGTMKWPTLTVEIGKDPVELLKAYPSQHVQAVIGDYAKELGELCGILGIRPLEY
jgi:L-fucose isomerase